RSSVTGKLPTVASLGGIDGKRVLVRSDLNVPLEGERITDDGRIRASAPQITALLAAGARVVVCAHLGRPQGTPDPKYSLAPVSKRLGEVVGRDVEFLTAVDLAPSTDLALLENVRFYPGETSKDDAERGVFADQLA